MRKISALISLYILTASVVLGEIVDRLDEPLVSLKKQTLCEHSGYPLWIPSAQST